MVTWFNKWLFICLVPAGLYMLHGFNETRRMDKEPDRTLVHPLHVSVTEIIHNAGENVLEISCRIFTDDFESVLAKHYKRKIDLVNPPDRAAMETLVSDFMRRHLVLKADGKPLSLSYLGYERDNDAVYSYLQVENIPAPKKLELTNTILHDVFTDQINLMHITIGGQRKSIKLDYPEKLAGFDF